MADISDPLQMWLDDVAYSHSSSSSTSYVYKYNFTRFCDFIERRPREILIEYEKTEKDRTFMIRYANHLRAWIGHLTRERYSKGTIRTMVGSVQSFFKYNNLPLGHVPQARKMVTFHNRDITRSEIAEVLRITDPRDRAFFCMMAQTGLRPQTLCNLKIKQIQPDFRKGRVPCKVEVPQELAKGKYRDYFTFMGPESVKHLKDYLKTRSNITPESHLFTLHGKEEKLDPKNMSHIFRRAIIKLKEKQLLMFEQKQKGKPSTLRLYNLRKFFRKMSHQAGFEIAQFWMGHTVAEGVDEHYRPKDTEFYRELYKEKAMSFLRLEEATPTETEKTISRLEEKNRVLTGQMQKLQKELEELQKQFSTYVRFAEGKQEEYERHEAAWELEEEQGRILEEMNKQHDSFDKSKRVKEKESRDY